MPLSGRGVDEVLLPDLPGTFMTTPVETAAMRRLRLTLRPGDVSIHPIGDVYLHDDGVDYAEAWTWNVEERPVALLFFVRGERAPVADVIAESDLVVDHEIVPVDEDSYYCYVHDECTDVSWELFQVLNKRGIVVVPPVRYESSEVTMTLLGDPTRLGAIVDEMPATLDARVDRVGAAVSPIATPAAALTSRQREAVEVGVAVGYYDVPRTADHEAVAERLGCAPSTAAEHLQKAEARLVHHVVSDR